MSRCTLKFFPKNLENRISVLHALLLRNPVPKGLHCIVAETLNTHAIRNIKKEPVSSEHKLQPGTGRRFNKIFQWELIPWKIFIELWEQRSEFSKGSNVVLKKRFSIISGQRGGAFTKWTEQKFLPEEQLYCISNSDVQGQKSCIVSSFILRDRSWLKR